MSQLTTVTLVQQQLGISSDDAVITTIVNGVNAGIETMLGITFGTTVYTNEEYDMNSDSRVLVLNNRPLVSISSLQFKNDPLNRDSTAWTDFLSSEYVVDLPSGLVTKNTIFRAGKRLYRATYIAGNNSIPDDIKLAATGLATAMYQGRKRAGVTAETLGQYSRQFSNDPLNWKTLGIDWILDNYKDKNIPYFGDAYRPTNTNINRPLF